jgi:MraZ protein
VLRGNFSAKIDDKGRLKIPTAFRTLIEAKYGASMFVTSVTGESVRIYPMPVWVGLETKLAAVPFTHPSRKRFSNQVNFYGQPAEFDRQGRVLVHGRVRESARMVGEVDVFGQYDHLEVWNHKMFLDRLKRDPFTDEDALALSEFGI